MLTPLSPVGGEEKEKKVSVSVFWWKKKKGKKLRPPIQCPCYFSGKTMLVVVRVFHVIDNYDCFFPLPSTFFCGGNQKGYYRIFSLSR